MDIIQVSVNGGGGNSADYLTARLAAWKADEPLSNRGRPQKGQGRKGDNVTISNRGNDTDYTLRRLARDWTQQRIADEVGVSRQYVTEVASKTSDSDKPLAIPSHVINRNDRADFRKLPEELREQSEKGGGRIALIISKLIPAGEIKRVTM